MHLLPSVWWDDALWYWNAHTKLSEVPTSVEAGSLKAWAGQFSRDESSIAPDGSVNVSSCHDWNAVTPTEARSAVPTIRSVSAVSPFHSCLMNPYSKPEGSARAKGLPAGGLTKPSGRLVMASRIFRTLPPKALAMSWAPRQMPSTGLAARWKQRIRCSQLWMKTSGAELYRKKKALEVR